MVTKFGPDWFIRRAAPCWLAVLFLSGFLFAASPAAPAKGKAYVWVGDVNPPWYSMMLRSPFGQVDPYKELQPVIDAQRKKMEAKGYQVIVVDTVSAHEIEKAIRDPQTKAFAFFGHGDENVAGTMSTLAGEDITAGDIKEWAQEALAERIGAPETWRGLDPAERKKRQTAWNNAHFNMDYVYMHTCYSLKDNSMVDALMANGGEFRGYKEKAYLKDESVIAKNELGRMEDQLARLREEHRALKATLDASGGYDEATSKEMKAVYQEYLKLKKSIDAQKAAGQ
jgi:hypothetical protein